MEPSRRDLSLLIPALMAAQTSAKAANNALPTNPLPSKVYSFDSLPLKTNPQTHNETRQVFNGQTHKGWEMDVHITTLAPGQAPHPPHEHVHEEIIFIKEGSVEVTMLGKTTTAGPGSVIYLNSNDRHGWKNVSDKPAQYFVLAVGREGA